MTNFHEYLPSTRNTIALLGGFALAAGIWWWTSGRAQHSPQEAVAEVGELDRIEYAIRNARSWRVSTAGTMHGQPFQTDQDVMCPFSSHTVTHTTSASGASSVAEEFIETKGVFYAREGNDPWISEPRPGSDKCVSGPMAGPAPLIATLESFRSSATLAEGELVQSGGNACRFWNFVAKDGGIVGSICVDEASRLPYEFRQGSLRVHYSNWNMPAAIDAPTVGQSNAPVEPSQAPTTQE